MANNPFLPVKFAPGPPTTPQWEDGPKNYVQYNGKTQTAQISTAKPPPPPELGPGAADPGIAASADSDYSGTGYDPLRYQRKGTIGAGTLVPVTPGGPPAQLRFYRGTDGNLYALDNETGKSFMVPVSGTVPTPPVYSPTK